MSERVNELEREIINLYIVRTGIEKLVTGYKLSEMCMRVVCIVGCINRQ